MRRRVSGHGMESAQQKEQGTRFAVHSIESVAHLRWFPLCTPSFFPVLPFCLLLLTLLFSAIGIGHGGGSDHFFGNTCVAWCTFSLQLAAWATRKAQTNKRPQGSVAGICSYISLSIFFYRHVPCRSSTCALQLFVFMLKWRKGLCVQRVSHDNVQNAVFPMFPLLCEAVHVHWCCFTLLLVLTISRKAHSLS
jgi:hypothetical protein